MTRPPVPPPVRLQVGGRLFVAVPAERAGAVAYVLALGAEHLRERDGVAGLDWLDGLLVLLRQVHAEAQAEQDSEPPSGVAGSAARTVRGDSSDESAWWAHDHVTITEAARITGWSTGYLARLGRAGYGVKRGGAWHLDRHRLLALADHRHGDARGAERAVRGPRREDPHEGPHAAA